MIQCPSGNQIVIKMISNVGEGNLKPKSNAKKVILNAGNISFTRCPASSLIFNAGEQICLIYLVILVTPHVGDL